MKQLFKKILLIPILVLGLGLASCSESTHTSENDSVEEILNPHEKLIKKINEKQSLIYAPCVFNEELNDWTFSPRRVRITNYNEKEITIFFKTEVPLKQPEIKEIYKIQNDGSFELNISENFRKLEIKELSTTIDNPFFKELDYQMDVSFDNTKGTFNVCTKSTNKEFKTYLINEANDVVGVGSTQNSGELGMALGFYDTINQYSFNKIIVDFYKGKSGDRLTNMYYEMSIDVSYLK